MSSQDFAASRLNMVENQVRTNDVTDLDIQDAMRVVPREALCPDDKAYLAYAEVAVEYRPGWHLMQPRDVAKILQAMKPVRGERALAIAAPYAAVVLTRMGVQVDARSAGEDLTAPVSLARYDLMICEGALAATPEAWLAGLAPGGRLGVVERTGPVGRAVLYTRSHEERLARREVFDATPPYAPGFEPAAVFTF